MGLCGSRDPGASEARARRGTCGRERIYIATDADAVGREFAATLKERFGDRALVLPSFKRFKNLQDIKDVNELMEKHPLDGRDIFARLVRYAETHQE